MTDLIDRLRAEIRQRQYDSGDMLYLGAPDPLLTEAADEIAALRARVAELEAENDRLTKAVGSGILGQLLNDEEQDEFVKFIKFLRGSPEAQSVVSNIGGSNDG